jgi:hypothetical protein
MWMWDTPQVYHQIGVERELQEKLAFAGPNATKWTYNVMHLGQSMDWPHSLRSSTMSAKNP